MQPRALALKTVENKYSLSEVALETHLPERVSRVSTRLAYRRSGTSYRGHNPVSVRWRLHDPNVKSDALKVLRFFLPLVLAALWASSGWASTTVYLLDVHDYGL